VIGAGRTGRSIQDFARRNEARVMWSPGAGEEKAFFTRRNVVGRGGGEERAFFTIRNLMSGEELRFEAKMFVSHRWTAVSGGGTKWRIWDSAKRNEAKVNWDASWGEERAFFTIRNLRGSAELRFEAKMFKPPMGTDQQEKTERKTPDFAKLNGVRVNGKYRVCICMEGALNHDLPACQARIRAFPAKWLILWRKENGVGP